MASIDKRIKSMEEDSHLQRQFSDEELFILGWRFDIDLALRGYESAKPACAAMKDGVCIEWYLDWPWLHHVTTTDDKRYESKEEAAQVIAYLYDHIVKEKADIQEVLEEHDLVGVSHKSYKRQLWESYRDSA